MLLGVVSDTHGHVPFARSAAAMLDACEVDEVLHCGDIGSPSIMQLFARWPTHYVLGNCDSPTDVSELNAMAENLGHSLHGRFGELERCGLKIALLHGDDLPRLTEAVGSGEFDLVCFGHTHVAECRRHGRTIALNPGALYRANPHSFALVELPSLKVTPVTL